MRTYTAAVAFEVGLPPAPGPVRTLAAAFYLHAESEEAAETMCAERTRDAVAEEYGLREGDRWRIVAFSAEEIPSDKLSRGLEMAEA